MCGCRGRGSTGSSGRGLLLFGLSLTVATAQDLEDFAEDFVMIGTQAPAQFSPVVVLDFTQLHHGATHPVIRFADIQVVVGSGNAGKIVAIELGKRAVAKEKFDFLVAIREIVDQRVYPLRLAAQGFDELIGTRFVGKDHRADHALE